MELQTRKQIRLPGYDYTQNGVYFITVCSQNRCEWFWKKNVGADSIRPNCTPLSSEYGKIAEKAIQSIPKHYPDVDVDHYCIMPNHIHILISIHQNHNGRIISAPTISTIIGQMKRWASRQIGIPIWQKSFHDHIIRSREEYRQVWRYIDENPLKWELDCYYNHPAN